MATYTPRRLGSITQLATTNSTLYTSSGVKTVIKEILVSNTSNTAATVTVNLVPSGASVAQTNEILCQITIAGYSTLTFKCSQVLEAGDFIVAKAGTSAVLNILVSGVEVA
jgi:hypothetical protein